MCGIVRWSTQFWGVERGGDLKIEGAAEMVCMTVVFFELGRIDGNLIKGVWYRNRPESSFR